MEKKQACRSQLLVVQAVNKIRNGSNGFTIDEFVSFLFVLKGSCLFDPHIIVPIFTIILADIFNSIALVHVGQISIIVVEYEEIQN